MNPKLLKTILSTFLIAGSASILVAQEIERKSDIKNFSSLSVSSGIDVYLTQGARENVVLKGDREDLDRLEIIKTDNGVLRLRYKDGSWSWGNWSNKNIKAYITVVSLNEISASGGSDITNDELLKFDKLNVTVSGGSDVKLNCAVNTIVINASGGSDIKLKGKANTMNLSGSGGSDISASEFRVSDVRANLSGGSDANLNAQNSIMVNASGGSDVSYSGSATKRTISATSASDVRKVN